MNVFDYIKSCSEEERREIVALFLAWFRETYHAASLNPHYMILERGELRPTQVIRAIATFSREKWFYEFLATAHAYIGKK